MEPLPSSRVPQKKEYSSSAFFTVQFYMESRRRTRTGPYSLMVNSGLTVGALKSETQRNLGIPPSSQIWVFGSCLAEEESLTLGDYGIDEEAFICLYVQEWSPREGPEKKSTHSKVRQTTNHECKPSSKRLNVPYKPSQHIPEDNPDWKVNPTYFDVKNQSSIFKIKQQIPRGEQKLSCQGIKKALVNILATKELVSKIGEHSSTLDQSSNKVISQKSTSTKLRKHSRWKGILNYCISYRQNVAREKSRPERKPSEYNLKASDETSTKFFLHSNQDEEAKGCASQAKQVRKFEDMDVSYSNSADDNAIQSRIHLAQFTKGNLKSNTPNLRDVQFVHEETFQSKTLGRNMLDEICTVSLGQTPSSCYAMKTIAAQEKNDSIINHRDYESKSSNTGCKIISKLRANGSKASDTNFVHEEAFQKQNQESGSSHKIYNDIQGQPSCSRAFRKTFLSEENGISMNVHNDVFEKSLKMAKKKESRDNREVESFCGTLFTDSNNVTINFKPSDTPVEIGLCTPLDLSIKGSAKEEVQLGDKASNQERDIINHYSGDQATPEEGSSENGSNTRIDQPKEEAENVPKELSFSRIFQTPLNVLEEEAKVSNSQGGPLPKADAPHRENKEDADSNAKKYKADKQLLLIKNKSPEFSNVELGKSSEILSRPPADDNAIESPNERDATDDNFCTNDFLQQPENGHQEIRADDPLLSKKITQRGEKEIDFKEDALKGNEEESQMIEQSEPLKPNTFSKESESRDELNGEEARMPTSVLPEAPTPREGPEKSPAEVCKTKHPLLEEEQTEESLQSEVLSDEGDPTNDDASSIDGAPDMGTSSPPVRLYDLLLNLEDQALVLCHEEFDCPVCLSPITRGEGILLRECLHAFCRSCLMNNLDFGNTSCMFSEKGNTCMATLHHREIRALVGTAKFERHLKLELTQGEAAVGGFHCRRVDCTGWWVPDSTSESPTACPICGALNCLPCGAIHDGLDCQQYLAKADPGTERLIESLLESGKALHCPKCHVLVMKRWGCDWVTCSQCGTEICWVTRGPRWGPQGRGDISGGCRCMVDKVKCHPSCNYCH